MKKLIAFVVAFFSAAALALPPTIFFDATSEGTGTTALSWTHTPVGAPKGIVTFCNNNTVATDVFSGATYGGVAMTLVGSASDTAGEPGFMEAYYLGTGIPTGAQTSVCTVASGTEAKWGVTYSLTNQAAGDMTLAGFCTVSEDAEGQCTITGLDESSYTMLALFSGSNAPSFGHSASLNVSGNTNDYGNQVTKSEGITRSIYAASVTPRFYINDDTALVAVALEIQ